MQSRGCHSYVGRITGAQPLYLDIPCQRVGVATHEIFHALGFHHEHQRGDRDKYIRIEWDNIKSTGCGTGRNVGCGIYFQKLKFTKLRLPTTRVFLSKPLYLACANKEAELE